MKENIKDRSEEVFEITWNQQMQIHYHSSFLMINISDIERIDEFSSIINFEQAQCKQIVLEVTHLQNIYVDFEYFEKVCTELRRRDIWQIEIFNIIRQQNSIIKRRFREVNNERYMILVTKLINFNMILLRTVDWFINLRMLEKLSEA